LRVVLDTCILKLATFPAEKNASALIYELARAGLIEAWVTPAILEEYADVLGDDPEFVAAIVESFPVCYPLTELSVVRHEPDNRFLECALAARRIHRHGEHGVRALRSRAGSNGEDRRKARGIPQRPRWDDS
jgi:predicted nucleic acid-binding protein